MDTMDVCVCTCCDDMLWCVCCCDNRIMNICVLDMYECGLIIFCMALGGCSYIEGITV